MLIYGYYIILIIVIFLFEKAIRDFMLTYMYENDLEIFINKEGISDFQESRYKKSSRILLLLIVMPLIRFNSLVLFAIILLSLYEYKKPYLKLKKLYMQELAILRYQFPIWLRQIQILLYSNNVLNSLMISLDLAPDILKNDLKIMIEDIKDSPNDLNAFAKFMAKYRVSEIDRAMKLLYRTYIIDQKDTTLQLNRMILSTTKWIREERVKRQTDNLRLFEWIGIIPLFGVTIVFLIIMASLINSLLGKGGIL